MSAASSAVLALAAAVPTAGTIDSASNALVSTLQQQAAAAVALIDLEVIAGASGLDNIDLSALMPGDAAAAFSALVTNADWHLKLVDARGLVGRTVSNLDQVVP